jgi:ribosome biogenesis GTPase A
VSAINKINLNKLVQLSREMIPPKHEKSVGSWMMIGGMPNVGKSTIINKLRAQAPKIRGKYITKTSKSPAETRHISGFRVSINPNAWLVDTPGIMLPSIQAGDLGLKLSLIGCINDKIIGKHLLVEYLLECLKRYNCLSFVQYYGLPRVPDTADELLNQIRERLLHADTERTAQVILDDFRQGRLGNITLDDVDTD